MNSYLDSAARNMGLTNQPQHGDQVGVMMPSSSIAKPVSKVTPHLCGKSIKRANSSMCLDRTFAHRRHKEGHCCCRRARVRKARKLQHNMWRLSLSARIRRSCASPSIADVCRLAKERFRQNQEHVASRYWWRDGVSAADHEVPN